MNATWFRSGAPAGAITMVAAAALAQSAGRPVGTPRTGALERTTSGAGRPPAIPPDVGLLIVNMSARGGCD
jgi:hypothetical protein